VFDETSVRILPIVPQKTSTIFAEHEGDGSARGATPVAARALRQQCEFDRNCTCGASGDVIPAENYDG
jgi:hypothetical protein